MGHLHLDISKALQNQIKKSKLVVFNVKPEYLSQRMAPPAII